jgi:hypothetical protein
MSAVQIIRRWWHDVGRVRYPCAKRLTIAADGGGSNGSRVRFWKRELQHLADELGIDIGGIPRATTATRARRRTSASIC